MAAICSYFPSIVITKKTDLETIQKSIVHHVTTTLARAAYNMDNFSAYQAVALRYVCLSISSHLFALSRNVLYLSPSLAFLPISLPSRFYTSLSLPTKLFFCTSIIVQ